MNDIVSINKKKRALIEREDLSEQEKWERASFQKKEVALAREVLLRPLLDMVDDGVSVNAAYRNLKAKVNCENVTDAYLTALEKATGHRKLPGKSSMHEWVKLYRLEGRNGLLPKHTGRVRQDHGWEAMAFELYNSPGAPDATAVARRLRERLGFESATDTKVRRYLNSLPATMGKNSPKRLGYSTYKNNVKSHVYRTTKEIPVGAIWQGDGHTLDIYIAHPVDGSPWRAELIVWMDLRSRKVVGWEIGLAENSLMTISSLARAIAQHNHQPYILYIDNGSGFKAKMTNDKLTGFYKRFDLEPLFSLPGNPKGKGHVERLFKTLERDFSPFFGAAFCGKGSSKEATKKLLKDLKQGKPSARLPTLEEVSAELAIWFGLYNDRPHAEEKYTSPNALFDHVEHNQPDVSEIEMQMPVEERVVRRGAIELHNRIYRHKVLDEYTGKKVWCAYSCHNDTEILVQQKNGALICRAEIVHRKPTVSISRIEDARQQRVKGQLQRLENKVERVRRQGGKLIEAEQENYIENAQTLDALEVSNKQLPDREEDIAMDLWADAIDPSPCETDADSEDLFDLDNPLFQDQTTQDEDYDF